MSNRAPCHRPGRKGAHVTKPFQTWDSVATLCNSHRNCLGLRRSSWISDPPKQFSFWYSCWRSIGNLLFGFIFLLFVTGQQLAPWNFAHTTVLHEISHIPPCSMKFRTYHRAPWNFAHTTVLHEISHIPPCSTHRIVLHKKNENFFFWGGEWCWWRMGDSWIPMHIRSVLWNHAYYRAPCRFWSKWKKQKKQVVIRFWLENGRMCGEVLGFNFQPWTLHSLLLWLAFGERDQKEIPKKYTYYRAPHILPCSTHTTVLHTYYCVPHIRPCSTQGVLPGFFLGTFVGVYLAQGIDVSGENEMAHTVDLNFHRTTLESLENSFASNLGWSMVSFGDWQFSG